MLRPIVLKYNVFVPFTSFHGVLWHLGVFDFLVTQGTTLAYGVAPVLRHMYRHVVGVQEHFCAELGSNTTFWCRLRHFMTFCGILGCFEEIVFFYFLVTQGTTLA